MAERTRGEVGHARAGDLVERVRRLIAEGDVRRITLRQGERILLDIPVRPGVASGVATALLDHVAAVAAVAETVAHCTIEVERTGDPENEPDEEGKEEPVLHAHIVRTDGQH